ncbi:MAG: PEGA domain-containing protein [bacterium]
MSNKMKMVGQGMLSALVCIIMVGCCSIVSGTSQKVAVNSNPSGARVRINGVFKGTTPLTVNLTRGETHTVVLELEGYQAYQIVLTSGINGWVWGNIPLGVLGVIVDAVDGAIYTVKPDSVLASLLRDNSAVVSIDVKQKPAGDLQKVGQLEKKASLEQQEVQAKAKLETNLNSYKGMLKTATLLSIAGEPAEKLAVTDGEVWIYRYGEAGTGGRFTVTLQIGKDGIVTDWRHNNGPVFVNTTNGLQLLDIPFLK